MPNRIIKESIRRSPEIDQLDWFEEVVFYRLITVADDYGCMDGRVVVLAHDLFPTKEKVSRAKLGRALEKMVELELLQKYVVDGAPYLRLRTWDKHQYVRRKRVKCPLPEDVAAQPTDGQPPTTDGRSTDNFRPMRAGAESKSQSKSKTESNRARPSATDYPQRHYTDAQLNAVFYDFSKRKEGA